MKNSLIRSLGIIVLIIGSSCGKDNSTNDLKTSMEVVAQQSISVSLSKSQIAADGADEVVFTVKDQNNVDVTALSLIYVNNIALVKKTFSATTEGSYQVKAVKGNLSSAIVNLLVSNLSSPIFSQKVLAEVFTGTWCGICPGVLIPLDKYTNSNSDIITIGVHGPRGSGDPFEYIFDSEMRNAFGVSGVPTVLLNRNSKWNENTASLELLKQAIAPLGIAIETVLNGNKISVKAKVKFGRTITEPLKLVIMLVEDDIPYNQANYGHFGLANPIPNFFHRNVLRTSATDIFGDAMPSNQQTKDNVWEKNFTIDAAGYLLSRCKVVGFVLYDTNPQNLKGVLNTQIVSAGQTVSFN